MKKVLSFIKKIIYKCCGKLRWLVLGGVLILLIQFFVPSDYMIGVKDEKSRPVREVSYNEVIDFSINKAGKIAVTCDYFYSGFTAIYDIETRASDYVNIIYVKAKADGEVLFVPDGYTITDDNIIYAIRSVYDDDNNIQSLNKEYIVRLSQNYEYIDDVCDFRYDPEKSTIRSELTGLNYYDKAVTFARVRQDGVRLYRINTDTNELEESRDYPTDENGTFTVNVIPVDGAFLFIRSDGNVYKVGFDEPMEECIYHYDNTEAAPYFTGAAMCGEDLYIFNENAPSKVYKIQDGSAKEVIDIGNCGHEGGRIKFLDSYISKDGKPVLTVCLKNGLLTYADGKVTEQDTRLKPDFKIMLYLKKILDWISYALLICIVINLIIRKKTLFYKQMLSTVPIFSIVIIIIAFWVYRYAVKQNNDNIKNEMRIITEIGVNEFKDYDFSGLLTISEETGAEYQKLCDKLSIINSDHKSEWSDDYIFSLIYRFDDSKAAFLTSDDRLVVPMCTRGEIYSEEISPDSEDFFFTENIISFIASDSAKSKISAFRKISDKDNTGKIFLRVTTSNTRFWYQRRQLFLRLIMFSALLIIIRIIPTLITSLLFSRTIKKATKVVKRISEGDLTARIRYKSDDELGEICNEVNSMGKSLEELFREKDKTEKFYYKFVPEQFRKLLGKEKFTELALGDSSSRELTVLFCDIRSFSINSEMMTAKENFEFVNIIYGIAGPIIRENGGFVDKYIGDAIMALFENADDAVRSGIEIYRSIVLDPTTAERLGVRDINIGIGIHSGMAQIGIVGETERLSGTVISDTVNLSSRLESLTKQYKTAMLISKDTVDRMSDPDSLNLRYLGIVQVAGVNEVKAVYEVLDCLPDEERESRQENTSDLREAIRLFALGRRDETVEMLRSIKEAGKGDYVTDLYLDYMLALSPDDSGNVFRFVRK